MSGKFFALEVTPLGDFNTDQQVLALVCLAAEDLLALRIFRDELPRLRVLAAASQRALVSIDLWTVDVEWIVADTETAELCNRVNEAGGVLSITEDEADELTVKHVCNDPDDKPRRLTTELDQVKVYEDGITYTCAEKHAAAIYTSHRISWGQLLDTQEPLEGATPS